MLILKQQMVITERKSDTDIKTIQIFPLFFSGFVTNYID